MFPMSAAANLTRSIIIVLALLSGPTAGRTQVVEVQPRGDAIQPSMPSAYEPCRWTPQKRYAMCLQDRLDLLLSLQAGRFEASNGECRLVASDETDPLSFKCGELHVALRPGISEAAWGRVLEASGGEVESGTALPNELLVRMKVRPGSERFALFNIIFEPDLLWADLNRNRVIEVLDQGPFTLDWHPI